MSFFKTIYFAVAGVAFFTIINDVLVLRWHSWDAHLFNFIPSGEIIGWFEIALFGLFGLASFYFSLKEFKDLVKKEK